MIREFTYTISSAEDGCTIYEYLKKKGYSHSVIVHLKKEPRYILRNGVWNCVNVRMQEGDTLQIRIEEWEGSPKIVPVALPFDILYEDEDILVVNKPADMPVHPSFQNYENTLANAVVHYYTCQNIPYTFRCVNRLDRDTTGVTLLAKHMLAAGILSVQMRERKIEKEYAAICEGHLPEQGTICAPIARVPGSAIARCVDEENGEEAITHYETVLRGSGFSLAKIHLETGRTHQIRVHMKHLGHPLLGDFLYHPDNHALGRQALHCCSLSFQHPITGERVRFQAPLPDDMKSYIERHS